MFIKSLLKRKLLEKNHIDSLKKLLRHSSFISSQLVAVKLALTLNAISFISSTPPKKGQVEYRKSMSFAGDFYRYTQLLLYWNITHTIWESLLLYIALTSTSSFSLKKIACSFLSKLLKKISKKNIK